MGTNNAHTSKMADAEAKPVVEFTKDFPKKDAAIAAGFKEKDVAKVLKEGGKKGVEIEGAADMSGLTCFCTRIQNAKGEVKLLEVAMEGMNAIPDPSDEEERKGCSGKISKIIISESEEKGQIAIGVRRRRDEGQAEREGLV